MQKSIEIRKENSISQQQLKEIMEIERASFKCPWSESMFLSYGQKFILAYYQNKIVGYICFSTVLDECHILNVAVHPDFRKNGIAQKMIDALFEEREKSGIKFYYLEVRVNNIPAINFYKKNGFKELGLRKKYYQDGTDAFVMVR
ncbi:ribosomal-protein-alanine N-acetyltransferase [Thermotomaculum hydrothermale]|uniref:[Ribosomal protein bS18]-alanine N-acetyltransferase n=1 Tax=Thermotomaculum hydrothermale TaxID=981385 RepID=A0A7R6PLY3_9BACT|nr:ribosomal protein S18-alanine N-acetyltransferase [Thermotomaculum hydrothermale]BBB31988.1 ribosomal-protein-alanine N-acetyltransferase [Thermotomaculum hydrothermale]